MTKESKEIKGEASLTKNLMILTSGTVLSQLIPILLMPVLTRMYTPESFGAYAIMLALIGIFMPMATARYEHAIMLPKEDDKSIDLLLLLLTLVVISSLFLLFVIIIFDQYLTGLIFKNKEHVFFLYLIPFVVFFTGASIGLNYYANRLKKYKDMSISRILRAFTSSIGQLLLFSIGLKNIGLGFGYLLGEAALFYYLLRKVLNDTPINYKRNRIHNVASRYKKFPQLDILSTVISQISQRGLIIIFGVIFTPAIAGLYGLTRHVLSAPLAFINTSVMDVFKQYATEDFRTKGNCRKLYWRFFSGLSFVSIIGFLILNNFGADIFAFVFGEPWRISGEYAEILSIVLLMRFVSSPLSYVLYIAEKQDKLLLIQVLFFIVMICSSIAGYFYQSVMTSLTLFSYLSSAIYAYTLYLSHKYSINPDYLKN